jgi:hypothetical protein
MTKEFAPYARALKLKQLGFDEPCSKWYSSMGRMLDSGKSNQPPLDDACSAPLFQQAFRWFREEHKLFVSIEYSTTSQTDFVITINKTAVNDARDRDYKTYEEAELAALDKLIEIVETKQQEQ